jgi:DNA-binding NtrC family response regulator
VAVCEGVARRWRWFSSFSRPGSLVIVSRLRACLSDANSEDAVVHPRAAEARVNEGGPSQVALVVDDEGVTRRTLREELEPRGFLVVEAAGGDEAWERFRKELPDLVVTDLRMPRGDGVALVRRIRREARSWVPIIVITSQTDLDIIKLAVQAVRESATEVLHLRRDLERLGEVARDLTMLSVRSLRRERRLRDMRTILSLLPECEGNVSKLSRLSEIPRSTLYGLLREMNLLDTLED